MQIRILSEHPHVAGKCGEVVEVEADETIAGLMAAGFFEPVDAPPAEPAKKKGAG